MNYDYMLIIGLENPTKEIYLNGLQNDDYMLISQTDDVVLARKSTFTKNLEKESELVPLITNISKKFRQDEPLFLDLTNMMKKLLEPTDPNKPKKDMTAWWLRQAITKAIVTKRKEEYITD